MKSMRTVRGTRYVPIEVIFVPSRSVVISLENVARKGVHRRTLGFFVKQRNESRVHAQMWRKKGEMVSEQVAVGVRVHESKSYGRLFSTALPQPSSRNGLQRRWPHSFHHQALLYRHFEVFWSRVISIQQHLSTFA